MFYDDHTPPHFHVRYDDQKAIVAIVRSDWELARQHAPLQSIPPLE